MAYQPNGHDFVIMGSLSSNPHSSANDIINATGMNPDDAFKAIDELIKQGILLRDKEMRIEESQGYGITKFATYQLNLEHPSVKKNNA